MEEKKSCVQQSEEKLLRAVRDCDTEAMERLIHPDAKVTDVHGQIHGRTSIVNSYREGRISLLFTTVSEQYINILSDYATVAGVMLLQGEYLGQRVSSEYEYLRLWIVDDTGCHLRAGSLTKRGTANAA